MSLGGFIFKLNNKIIKTDGSHRFFGYIFVSCVFNFQILSKKYVKYHHDDKSDDYSVGGFSFKSV